MALHQTSPASSPLTSRHLYLTSLHIGIVHTREVLTHHLNYKNKSQTFQHPFEHMLSSPPSIPLLTSPTSTESPTATAASTVPTAATHYSPSVEHAVRVTAPAQYVHQGSSRETQTNWWGRQTSIRMRRGELRGKNGRGTIWRMTRIYHGRVRWVPTPRWPTCSPPPLMTWLRDGSRADVHVQNRASRKARAARTGKTGANARPYCARSAVPHSLASEI